MRGCVGDRVIRRDEDDERLEKFLDLGHPLKSGLAAIANRTGKPEYRFTEERLYIVRDADDPEISNGRPQTKRLPTPHHVKTRHYV